MPVSFTGGYIWGGLRFARKSTGAADPVPGGQVFSPGNSPKMLTGICFILSVNILARAQFRALIRRVKKMELLEILFLLAGLAAIVAVMRPWHVN